MRSLIYFFTILVLMSFLMANALAQDVVIYPAQGQSQQQMEKDKFECYSWAKQQTGFDPMETPKATAPPPPQSGRSVAGGAVRGGIGGAALGAGIGAIAGGGKGAGKGAAIGGLAGGTLGAARSSAQKRQEEQARQQWEQEQAAQYTQKRDGYNRAYSACLEGKGYTVK
jgi:predicted lipid-binding transport protein (Tim44 family)